MYQWIWEVENEYFGCSYCQEPNTVRCFSKLSGMTCLDAVRTVKVPNKVILPHICPLAFKFLLVLFSIIASKLDA